MREQIQALLDKDLAAHWADQRGRVAFVHHNPEAANLYKPTLVLPPDVRVSYQVTTLSFTRQKITVDWERK